LQREIDAAVTKALAPFKAAIDALAASSGQPEATDPARVSLQVAIEKFMRAYAEGRLGPDDDRVQ
jgi:hypothetical protein